MSDHEEKVSIKISTKSGFTHILFALAAKGYTHVVIEYSGSGDNGAIDSVRLYEKGYVKETIDGDDIQMELEAGEGIACEKGLEERIEEYVYTNILDTLTDWVNNDGGQGTLIISTADGTYYCDHSYNVTNQVYEPSSGKVGD